MSEYILFGSGYAFAAGVQPGPLQAFLLSRVAATGWKRTLPASFAPLLSDIPTALLVLLVLGQLSATAQNLLRAAGGVVLLYLAWLTIRRWRESADLSVTSEASAPRTLLQAALVNLLSPNPYLGWALVLGPAVVTAWRSSPSGAIAILVAFYGTLVATIAASIVVFGTARLLGPRGLSRVVGLSAVILGALGVYQLIVGVAGLRAS